MPSSFEHIDVQNAIKIALLHHSYPIMGGPKGRSRREARTCERWSKPEKRKSSKALDLYLPIEKEGYGLSETSPVLCLNPMSVTEFTGSCGLPVPSTEIKLLKEDGTEAEIGEAGEICARGPQVMRGYWHRDDANAVAFTEDGFFRTGDVGIFDENGFLRIVDRLKDMIIVSGFNVYPNEIEAIAASYDGVAECACIGVPDEKTGEAVALFVIKLPGAEVDTDDLISFCKERLTGYKTPRHIRFVDDLPKTNVGKILRRELRKIF